MGVRLPGNNVYLVTRLQQGLAEIANIDTLPAPKGMAAVSEDTDLKRVLMKPLGDGHDVGNLGPRLLGFG
jgi:hypothetical protein